MSTLPNGYDTTQNTILNNKAAKDGSDTGAVTIGNTTNNEVKLRRNNGDFLSAFSNGVVLLAGPTSTDIGGGNCLIQNSGAFVANTGTVTIQANTAGANMNISNNGLNAPLNLIGRGGVGFVVTEPEPHSFIFSPTSNAASQVVVGIGNVSSAGYSARIGSNPQAVPNMQRLNDSIAAQTLNNHVDVTITAPVNNDVLSYSSGQWVNKPASLAGDLNLFTEATMISAITPTNTGVENKQFGGTYLITTASIAFPSGTILTVAQTGETDNGILRVKPVVVTGGEENAETQVIGVALNDASGAGSVVRVAITGIVSVFASGTFTALRGALMVVDNVAGKARIITSGTDEASVGVCLSKSATNKVLNSPVLIALRAGYSVF